jgi:predicted NAD/FAD-binding protein
MVKFNLKRLISQHTTNWFHRVQSDEMSAAISLHNINSAFLNYLECQKLDLTISKNEFRKNLSEFLCTYYVAKKQNIDWNGPLSPVIRPQGWTNHHEQEWNDYLRHEHLSYEFWGNFWQRFPEATWETSVSGWRDAYEYIVSKYILVKPNAVYYTESLRDEERDDEYGVHES